MIGRVVRMALRDPLSGVDDYISALWCQIRTYPLGRRPQRIVANLSMDTLKTVSTERRGVKYGEVSPWPPESFLGGALDARLVGVASGGDDEPRRCAEEVLQSGRRLDLLDQPT